MFEAGSVLVKSGLTLEVSVCVPEKVVKDGNL